MARHAILGAVTMVVVLACAAVADDTIYLGGFVSQGYINTANNNYLVGNTRDGSSKFTEVAVQVSTRPVDKLHVGLQLLGRDFASSDLSQVAIDWAYGDYRWRDGLGVRAGRIKLPYGLYNQGRDVDMLRTSVLLPQSVYSEYDRDLLIAYEGVGLYGNLPAGRWGEFDYELVYGSLNIRPGGLDQTNEEFRAEGLRAESAVAAQVAALLGVPADSVTARNIQTDDLEINIPWIAGGSLIWSTPFDGLRLGTSYMAGDAEARGTFRYDVLVSDGGTVPGYLPWMLELDRDLEWHDVFTGSLEYVRSDWLAAAEFVETRFGDITSLGWYASLQRRVDRRWSFETVYASTFPDMSDRDGDDLVAVGLPDHGAWQNDLGLAVRIDLNPHWLLKLEYHYMDGTALVTPNASREAEPGDRHWRMMAAKTTFHF